MEQWYLYKKKADFTKIGEKFQIDPVIARLIRNRDVIGDEEIHKYLYGNLSDISDPFLSSLFATIRGCLCGRKSSR